MNEITIGNEVMTVEEWNKKYPYGKPLEFNPIANHDNGLGTPSHRFNYLMDELAKRFPEAEEPFSAQAGEHRYLKAIDELIAERYTKFPTRVAGRDFHEGDLVERVLGRAHSAYDVWHGGVQQLQVENSLKENDHEQD